MHEENIDTEFGTLWTAHSGSPNNVKSSPPIIFLHGNSADPRIFEPLLNDPQLKDKYNLILFDYPGHGRSEDAPDPDKAYFQYVYAEAALKVLQHYNVDKFIAVGWSLGGHVALELISVLATPENKTNIKMVGAVITGTPPVPKQKITGFRKDLDLSALFNPEASKEDLLKVADVLTKSDPAPTWLQESVVRTNRAAGRTMAVKFMEGHCSDQIQIVHSFKNGWIAVINGGDDNVLDVDYCDEVCEGAPRLWRGKCIRLPGQKHTPFYDEPDAYRKVLLEYLSDCEMS